MPTKQDLTFVADKVQQSAIHCSLWCVPACEWDRDAAFILSHLVYFRAEFERGEHVGMWDGRRLWITTKRHDWWKKALLSLKQTDAAIEHLIKLGFVVKDVRKRLGTPMTALSLNDASVEAAYRKLNEVNIHELFEENHPTSLTAGAQRRVDARAAALDPTVPVGIDDCTVEDSPIEGVGLSVSYTAIDKPIAELEPPPATEKSIQDTIMKAEEALKALKDKQGRKNFTAVASSLAMLWKQRLSLLSDGKYVAGHLTNVEMAMLKRQFIERLKVAKVPNEDVPKIMDYALQRWGALMHAVLTDNAKHRTSASPNVSVLCEHAVLAANFHKTETSPSPEAPPIDMHGMIPPVPEMPVEDETPVDLALVKKDMDAYAAKVAKGG